MKSLLVAAGALGFCAQSVLAQGSLAPPSSPGPTMKTLDQIDSHIGDVSTAVSALNGKLEARVPINATNTPGNSNYDFVINQPGSYYVTQNISAAHSGCIRIAAPHVTLDLNGFELSTSSAAFGSTGIQIAGSNNGATIRNGSIVGFTFGVIEEVGGSAAPTAGVLLDLNVAGCAEGIALDGPGWLLRGCRLHDSNSAVAGVRLGPGAMVTDCVVFQAGGPVGAIVVGNASSVIRCAVYNNQGPGIAGAIGCLIKDCVAANNSGDGITIDSASTVEHCVVNHNALVSSSPMSAGIHATGYGNRIDSNEVRDQINGFGIRVDLANAHNVIIRNTAGNNSGGLQKNNYSVASGNGLGPIISADIGDVGNSSNSPFANIEDF